MGADHKLRDDVVERIHVMTHVLKEGSTHIRRHLDRRARIFSRGGRH